MKKPWFDSIWPYTSPEDERCLVPIHSRDTSEKATDEADKRSDLLYLFLIEDFDLFVMPPRWLRMPPTGGIPPNIWVGVAFETNFEAAERVRRLLKIRAKNLFIVGKEKHETIDLEPLLVPWRCNNCGRRGNDHPPPVCPTGSICDGSKLEPQIHQVVDMDREDGHWAQVCEKYGVPLWQQIRR